MKNTDCYILLFIREHPFIFYFKILFIDLFLLHLKACMWKLSSLLSAVKACSRNHWTSREFP